jgi:hypothetical protein
VAQFNFFDKPTQPIYDLLLLMKTRHILSYILPIWGALLLYACANEVAPTGGPRDEEPPRVIRSNPPNFSANFDDNQIRIFFDEYVRLQNIQQQLLVSPPLEQSPEVRMRGRSIIIDIEEELRSNSTYNVFFGDAIRDITEGNAIPNFQFVFSTGVYVDSLSMRGQVINAFNHDAEEGVYVMLYDNVIDSVPYLERPVYLAKTDKEGQFVISNMADGEYLMFALRDNNSNFLFDLPGEEIAFVDSLVRPEYVEPKRTELTESREEQEIDDALPDKPEEWREAEELTPDNGDAVNDSITSHKLYLFQETDTVQRVTSASLVKTGLLAIAFRLPYDSAHVREIRQPFDVSWHIPEFNTAKDTLKIWFTETGRDSLFLEIRDRKHILDTIAQSTTPRTRSEENDTLPEPLSISFNYSRASAVPFFQPLGIISEHPLNNIQNNKIELLAHDSIPVESSFYFMDELRRTVLMEPLPAEGTPYSMNIMPGAFTDIFGLTNDTIQSRFRTTTIENYGNLIVALSLPAQEEKYVLQLLDNDRNILRERTIHEGGNYKFDYLNAGNYGLRLFHDVNKNGRWDSGNYLKQVQPEPVFMYPENIQIRENWDVEVPFEPI